jgi:NAD(P)-dependent dehydrogenase (short-subunit alcohol dehydrogenase family)
MTVTTLVTGATKGIGRAICERLRRDGHDVVGIARSEDPSFPGKLYLGDLGDEAATAAVMDKILAEHQIHNLVNNAGASAFGPLKDFSIPELWRMMEMNVRAAAQVTKACVTQMIGRKKGRIVNITSVAELGRAGTPGYSASKAALNAMTRSWALEFAADGITVNSVSPGVTATEMFNRNNPPGHPRRQAVQDFIPMHRLAEPREIAGAVMYFLADDSSYTTGQTLFVTGGWEINAP